MGADSVQTATASPPQVPGYIDSRGAHLAHHRRLPPQQFSSTSFFFHYSHILPVADITLILTALSVGYKTVLVSPGFVLVRVESSRG
jgi:hypothetical protein